MADLTFYPWYRSNLYETVTGTGADGRAVGTLKLTLTENYSGRADSPAQPLEYHVISPRDVAGLQAGVILHCAPAPLARDAETTKLVHVDFREADLPWRYTPTTNTDPLYPTAVKPWLVLLVGTAEEIKIDGNQITYVSDAVYAEHDLSQSALWAHVQTHGDNATQISRLISPRGLGKGLLPQTGYVAALVPAFTDQAQPMWDAGHHPASLPVYYSWRFWTTESGDFETLAEAITPRPGRGLGRAALYNPRVVDADGQPVMLEARGAISSLIAEPDGGQALIDSRADLDLLNNAIPDDPPLGFPAREIIGLPGYGLPWLPDLETEGWGKQLNEDPRYRGDAGLGLWLAIQAQEDLLNAATIQMGSAGVALGRLAHLAMGINAARRLWDRRLPASTARQLRVFGSAMRRMRADGGTVLSTALNGSALSAGYFSSAAQRVFRRGTARSRHSADGYFRADDLLAAANTPPPQPDKAPNGLAHIETVGQPFGLPAPEELPGVQPLPPDLIDFLTQFVSRIIDIQWVFNEIGAHLPEFGIACDPAWLLGYFRPFNGRAATLTMLVEGVQLCIAHSEGFNADKARRAAEGVLHRDVSENTISDLIGFAQSIAMPQPPSPYRAINVDRLAEIVRGVIDPHNPNAPAVRRVFKTISGLNLNFDLTPPEVAISVDYPTWMLLKQYDNNWLLPGVGQLEKNSVVAMETNPVFISAFMVGVNTQYVNEMHWRNLPIDRYSTPLLMFWGAFNYESNQREPDIQPIVEWEADKPLGDLSHQWIKPGDTTGKRDVVIVFHTDLFRRYPSTVVYLTKRQSEADLVAAPDLTVNDANKDRAVRLDFGPIFQGAIEPDIVFFGFDVNPDDLAQYELVLDEPPSELRFQNMPDVRGTSHNGAEFGAAAIDRHTRVAISGAYLQKLGLTVERNTP